MTMDGILCSFTEKEKETYEDLSVRESLPGTEKFSVVLAKYRYDCRQRASILEEKKRLCGDERLLHVGCHRTARSLKKHHTRQ